MADGFKPSEREFDWLGRGVYFWEDSPARARLWAGEKFPNEATCVVDAEISLKRCLNLADPEGVARLRPYYDSFIETFGVEMAATLKSTPEGNRQLDCRVINWACERWLEGGDPVEVVREAFREGKPLLEGVEGVSSSEIHTENHVQLAVREDAAILNFRVVN